MAISPSSSTSPSASVSPSPSQAIYGLSDDIIAIKQTDDITVKVGG